MVVLGTAAPGLPGTGAVRSGDICAQLSGWASFRSRAPSRPAGRRRKTGAPSGTTGEASSRTGPAEQASGRPPAPALEGLVAADALAVHEHLRHGLLAADGADEAAAVGVRQGDLDVVVAEGREQRLRPRAELAALAGEDGDLVRDMLVSLLVRLLPAPPAGQC